MPPPYLYWARTSRAGNLFLCVAGSTLYEISDCEAFWHVRDTRTGQGVPKDFTSLDEAKKWCTVVATLEMG